MIAIGIDPGLVGALAAVSGQNLLWVIDMPVEPTGSSGSSKRRVAAGALAEELRRFRAQHPDDLLAVIEKVASSPQMGVASAFAFGDTAGVLRGVLQTLGIRIEYVRPQSWKQALRVGRDKAVCRTLAAQRWPDHAALFARQRDDGRAEAALIAQYGWDRFA